MRRLTSLIGIVVFGVAFGLVGCDSQKQGEQTKEGEESEAEAPEENEADEAKQAQQGPDAQQGAGEYSREDYVKASVELACVDQELAGEEGVEMDKVEEDILGKYGFDEESYQKAEKEFAENDEVTEAIDKQLEECTSATARQFAGLEPNEEKAKEGGEEKAAEPTPPVVGSVSSTVEDSGGFSRAVLEVTVQKDYSATGTFKGRREGKGFQIPLEGEVSKSNNLSLSGSSGKNEVSVSGNLKESGTTAEVSGSIWERKFSTTMDLN